MTDYIKNDRTSGMTVAVASFIAALFLSLLCCLFYNFWLDGIEGAKREDGDWHGRVIGEIREDDLAAIRHFANVERAVVNEELSGDWGTVVDIYFYDKRTIRKDMSAILAGLGLPEDAAGYNYGLLSLYFIRIPGDDKPRLLMPAYFLIVLTVCVSLILVIHNAFAVSMDSRVHHLGILTSIGATPRQIRSRLLGEAFVIALPSILIGILSGVALSFGVVRAMIAFAEGLTGDRQMSFGCHPALLCLILLLSVLTVLISAWIPAHRLSRLTPLEAIRGTGELQLEKRHKFLPVRKHSPFLQALFGMEGELAGNALRAQKRALRTTSLSLTLAFSGFMVMQCFWTLSGISTDHTYFERYRNAWDIMVTVRDTRIEDFALTDKLRELSGTADSVVYQKVEAVCLLPRERQSPELLALGGLETFAGAGAFLGEDTFAVEAPIIILDDESFGGFCEQIGAVARMDGTIILNRFWDSIHSNFRYRAYIPYVEDMEAVTLYNAAAREEPDPAMSVEVPVLACTVECPLLREDYDDWSLVQFIPLSLWKEIGDRIGGEEPDLYVRVLAEERTDPAALSALEGAVSQIISPEYESESENRIQERIDNDKMIAGYELILGAFCALFAIIGIAHVFSNTLGFLRQRKREFARYMSVGLTPGGMRKMFCIETVVIAGRPTLIALALTVLSAALMIRASYLDPMEFIRVAPVMPIAGFVLTVFVFVALAYFLGGRKMLRVSLAEVLRDDSMM